MLVYPLSLAVFWNALPIASAPFRLSRYDEASGLGSGRIISAETASPLWRAAIGFPDLTLAERDLIPALIESLDGAQKSFLASPKARAFPYYDPAGAILGGATPEIAAVGADNKSLTIEGLPAFYQLRTGDFFSFQVSGRHHLHQFAESGTASGAGVTPSLEVRPHFRPGVAAGLAVTLARPLCQMIIEPGTYEPGAHRGAMLSGLAFTAVQKV